MAKLEALTYEMNDYGEFEPLIPPLIETLTFMIDNVSAKKYENLAQITINCVNNLLKLLNSGNSSNQSNNALISRGTTLCDAQTNILYINKTVLSDTIILALKAYLQKSPNESIKKEIENITSSFDQSVNSSNESHAVPKEFTSPQVQEVKKNRKREASIVNTVVENGEEYVVVKSNWKFNPKNLTENQKEKFKRKRDIPALYQDLSQSQDEFKLSTWKTDSQDTSLSSSKSSKSATTNDASEILKTMPGTEVVPKIMENILDSTKTTNHKMCVVTSPVSNDKLNKVEKVVCTPIGTKSPRMAFKDRVFRNVKMLIEKSSPSAHIENEKDITVFDTVCKSPTRKPSNEKVDKTGILNQIDNVSKSLVSEPKAIDNRLRDKEDNQTLMTTSPNTYKNKIIAVTAQEDNQNIKLVHTPAIKTKKDDTIINLAVPLQFDERPTVYTPAIKAKIDEKTINLDVPPQSVKTPAVHSQTTKTKKDDKITISAIPLQSGESPAFHTPSTKNKIDDKITHSAQSDERPARMKRKPKKFDGTLLLPLKKSRNSNNESQTNSQESSVQPEITVAQVHTTEDVFYNTNIDQPGISTNEKNDAAKNVNANKGLTIPNKVALVKDALITPTTPITDKTTEKSPEKPTTIVEVPNEKDKASHGIENNVTQIVSKDENVKEKSPTVRISVIKIKEAAIKNSPGKRAIKLLEKNTTPLNKLRKTTVHTENVGEDDTTLPVSELLDKTLDLNQEKSPANKSMVENGTDKESDVGVPPINKVNKDKDSQKSTKSNLVPKQVYENDEKSESVPTQPSVSKEARQPKSGVVDKEMLVKTNKNENKILQKQTTAKNKVEDVTPKSTIKKTARKSRIESELMIDMVEGHPFLKTQSERRLTRKKIMEVENNSRRKSLAYKLNKSKLEATPKSTKNLKDKRIFSNRKTVTVEESQDKQTSSPEDTIMNEPPCSEDIIESSQDSTITTISVKSTKRTPVREPIVSIERLSEVKQSIETQDLIKDSEVTELRNEESHEKTDIELPQNKTAEVDKNTTDLTENMDTEPIGDINASVDIIILDSTESFPFIINAEPVIGPETQELAEADTQPNDPEILIEIEGYLTVDQPQTTTVSINEQDVEKEIMDNDITLSLPEPRSLANIDNTNEVSSPFKNDDLRKQDFLNNTLEISPIKIRSPEREKKSPSPETSSDFVIIQLSSPVHSNGEPFEKHGSPEFFTEDKVSPDKRDVSPPRPEIAVTNFSPSSILSLKKNRAPVRSGGRAAQMLDLLCVNSDLKITKVSEHVEPEDLKKATTSTPARRNLRILYNSVGENSDHSSDQNLEEDDNFLKLKRSLPTVTSSPSGPILKRKLVDIMDEATASPASKVGYFRFHLFYIQLLLRL